MALTPQEITFYAGDTNTVAIPLKTEVDGAAFSPGSAYHLIFTAKASNVASDAGAKFQYSSGAGIVDPVVSSSASVTFHPTDTRDQGGKTLYWDIQAEHETTGVILTVAIGTLVLKRDTTRQTTTSVPIHTHSEAVPYTGPSAYDSYVATTSDDPVLSEAAWVESLGSAADPDTVVVASPVNDDMIQRVGGSWVTRTLAQIKTALGLGSAAYTASGDYATAAQGTLADSASQPGHAHVSADVTDATSSATPATLVLRGANGEAEFGDFGNSFIGNGVFGAADSGIGVFGDANTGYGVIGLSASGTGSFAKSSSGTNHAEFGYTGDDRSFVRRVLGLIGWHRGNYVQTLGSPATLTADSALELPDVATGTLALTSDIPAAFATNKATLVAGDKIALLDSEDTDAPKHGLLSAIANFIIGTGRTLSGAWAFSSTTRPTSSGTGNPAATSLIMRDDLIGEALFNMARAQRSDHAFSYTANGGTANQLDGDNLIATTVANNRPVALRYRLVNRYGSGSITKVSPIRISSYGTFIHGNTSNVGSKLRCGVGMALGASIPAAEANALAGSGFGWEILWDGTNIVFSLFAHNGTTYVTTDGAGGRSSPIATGISTGSYDPFFHIIIGLAADGTVSAWTVFTNNPVAPMRPSGTPTLTLAGGPTTGNYATSGVQWAAVNHSTNASFTNTSMKVLDRLLIQD